METKKMEKIIEHIKSCVIYCPKLVDECENLTEFINSINFERFGVEKSEETISAIEQQVRKDLTIKLDSLDKSLKIYHFDNPALFQILKNQRDNIKKIINGDEYRGL